MDKQELIERLLNEGIISEAEAEELAELPAEVVAGVYNELGG